MCSSMLSRCAASFLVIEMAMLPSSICSIRHATTQLQRALHSHKPLLLANMHDQPLEQFAITLTSTAHDSGCNHHVGLQAAQLPTNQPHCFASSIKKDLACKQAIFDEMHNKIAKKKCDLGVLEYMTLVESNETVGKCFTTLTQMVGNVPIDGTTLISNMD